MSSGQFVYTYTTRVSLTVLPGEVSESLQSAAAEEKANSLTFLTSGTAFPPTIDLKGCVWGDSISCTRHCSADEGWSQMSQPYILRTHSPTLPPTGSALLCYPSKVQGLLFQVLYLVRARVSSLPCPGAKGQWGVRLCFAIATTGQRKGVGPTSPFSQPQDRLTQATTHWSALRQCLGEVQDPLS